MFLGFCKQLIKEVTGGPVKRDITSYVDHYGKDVKGFLTYPEFKEIYMIHVAPNDIKAENRLGASENYSG